MLRDVPWRAALIKPLPDVGKGVAVVAVAYAAAVAVAALFCVECCNFEDVRRDEGDGVGRVAAVILVGYLPDDGAPVVGRAGVLDLRAYREGGDMVARIKCAHHHAPP